MPTALETGKYNNEETYMRSAHSWSDLLKKSSKWFWQEEIENNANTHKKIVSVLVNVPGKMFAIFPF